MATNTLGNYDPYWYANSALEQLWNALGMARGVYRDFDPTPTDKGSTIQLRTPSIFTAQDAPSSPQDLNTKSASITIDKHKEVTFELTDKQASYNGEQIIEEHIRPQAYALANQVDQDLTLLYKDIPWFVGTAGTTPATVAAVASARARLRKNAVNYNDPSKLWGMLDPDAEAALTALEAFGQNQGAGTAGINTQMTGNLGYRYGHNWFTNQNVQTHTAGTCSATTLAVNGATSAGATTIALDAGSVSGTLVAGDTFVIAGNTQRYAVTETATAASNAFTSVSFTPALAANAADNAVVTVTLQNGVRNMAWYRDAFCLAVRPLSTLGDGRGAEMGIAMDETTGLALRSTLWYSGTNRKLYVSLDILYQVKTLNPNMAVCLLG